jgi:YfiH family protein
MQAVESGRFIRHITSDVAYLEPTSSSACERLRCAFTLRQAGTSGRALNLSFDRGRRAEVEANRQRVLQSMGLGGMVLHAVRQVHGAQVCVVDEVAVQQGLHGVEADALVTTLPATPLGVLVADCLPIVVYGFDPPVLALIHAGRMGTYRRIVRRVLGVIHRRLGVASGQLYAILGPAIGGCCYRLDRRAVDPFRQRFLDWQDFFTPDGEQHWRMDLIRANQIQLQSGGIPASHIETADICTVCHHRQLFSHRAEGEEAGRGMGIAVLLPA